MEACAVSRLTPEEEAAAIAAVQTLPARATLEVTLSCLDGLALVSELQLALRHPMNVGPAAIRAERVARCVQAELTKIVPELGPVLELGWNPDYDQPSPLAG